MPRMESNPVACVTRRHRCATEEPVLLWSDCRLLLEVCQWNRHLVRRNSRTDAQLARAAGDVPALRTAASFLQLNPLPPCHLALPARPPRLAASRRCFRCAMPRSSPPCHTASRGSLCDRATAADSAAPEPEKTAPSASPRGARSPGSHLTALRPLLPPAAQPEQADKFAGRGRHYRPGGGGPGGPGGPPRGPRGPSNIRGIDHSAPRPLFPPPHALQAAIRRKG